MADMGELIVRLVVSLGVVLGIVWTLFRLSQKRLGGNTALVGVVGRHAVGRNASVTVVSVAGRVLVLGVSEHQVQLLTELDPTTLDDVADAVPAEEVVLATGRASSPRGAHAAPVARGQQLGSLGGSILSARTWRDAWTATRGGKTA